MNRIEEKNLERLQTIKTMLDEGNTTKMADIRAIGGGALFYNNLVKTKVLLKKDGVWQWSPSIPISKTLAKTLTDITKEMNSQYRKEEGIKVATVKKVYTTEPKIEKDFMKKPIKRRASKPKRVAEPIESKQTTSLSLFWGLVKYNSTK